MVHLKKKENFSISRLKKDAIVTQKIYIYLGDLTDHRMTTDQHQCCVFGTRNVGSLKASVNL